MRRVAVAVTVVLVVLAGVLWYVASRLDGIVERAIERHGSAVAGSAVRVASVSLDLDEARGTVRGLRVANPEGFSSASAIEVGEVRLQIDPASLTGGPVRLREVRLVEPRVRYELDAMGRSNIDVLRDHAGRTSPERAEPDGDPARLAIETFTLERGVVASDARALGGEERSAPLPPLRLRHVGGRNGAPPAEVARTLLVALAQEVAATVARHRLRTYLEEQIDEHLEGLSDAAKDVLRGILGDEPAPSPSPSP